MSTWQGKSEKVNAFISAMGQEHYYRLLDFAGTIVSKGYASNKTYDEVLEILIEKEYEKAEGKLKNVGIMPSIDKIDD